VLVGAARREDPTSARMAASPLSNALGVEGSAILGLLGSACRVRRDAFLAVGGYEPRFFLGAEESLLAADLAAAGWRMAYVPAATVCHAPSPLRDNVARRRLEARNALWFACLRRPPAVVAKATLAWWKALRRDPHRTRALFDAMAGPAWVLRERRVLPPYVDQTLQSIESFYAARRKAKAAVPKLESTPS
jgi:GT2 family glycosyltransferase